MSFESLVWDSNILSAHLVTSNTAVDLLLGLGRTCAELHDLDAVSLETASSITQANCTHADMFPHLLREGNVFVARQPPAAHAMLAVRLLQEADGRKVPAGAAVRLVLARRHEVDRELGRQHGHRQAVVVADAARVHRRPPAVVLHSVTTVATLQ